MIAFNKKEIPYLTVIIDPTSEHPVILTLNDDYLETGEYVLSVTPLEALEIACQAIKLAADFMSDELWEMLENRKKAEVHYSDEDAIKR